MSLGAGHEAQAASGHQPPQAHRGTVDTALDVDGIQPAWSVAHRFDEPVHARGEPTVQFCLAVARVRFRRGPLAPCALQSRTRNDRPQRRNPSPYVQVQLLIGFPGVPPGRQDRYIDRLDHHDSPSPSRIARLPWSQGEWTHLVTKERNSGHKRSARWKHALGLARLSHLPRYEVREGTAELTFLAAVVPEGAMAPLLVAGSADGRLRLRETEQYRRMSEEHRALWARRSCAIGEPEGLAYKIGIFERVAREDGWRVESPYPAGSVRPPTGRGGGDGPADGPSPRPTAAAHP